MSWVDWRTSRKINAEDGFNAGKNETSMRLGKKMERIKDEDIECMKIHEPDPPITLACSLQVVGSTIFLLWMEIPVSLSLSF